MRLTHLGHACLLIESAGARVLVDPGTFSSGFETLEGLDAVVVTHQHPDHMDLDRLPALLERNPQAQLLADPQSVGILSERGHGSARTLVAGDEHRVGGARLHPVGELHAVIHAGVPRPTNVGVVVRADGEPGQVDVLAVPVNAPWCKVSESIEVVRRIAPRAVTPIHQALLSPTGLALYLQHITTYGGDDLTLVDLSDGQPHEV